ncbi:MAG: hypothetical protein WAR78_08960 [Ferruginibacter sp.]
MKYNKTVFIKGITLLSFMILISIFLLYRTGSFNSILFNTDPTIQTSPNGGKIPAGKNTDTDKPLSMSSSKSLVLTDNNPLHINKRKRDYLYYAIALRSEIFQDSLRKLAKPLPMLFQEKLDSIKLKDTNLFYFK